jgi:hypothetical protein
MQANLLENKQNPAGGSALPRARLRGILGSEHGNKGVEEFAQGSLASALRPQRPACLGPALVKCLEQETYERGYREEPLQGAGRVVGKAIDCTRSAKGRSTGLHVAPAWSVRSEAAGARAGSAGMTGFFVVASDVLFRRSRRRLADCTDGRCSLGLRGVRLTRAVDVTG